MKIGFIGLGNVGGKLAGSLLRNGFDLTVRDLDLEIAQPFLDKGAAWADSPKEMAEAVDFVITCLPSPAASATVMEAEDGILAGLSAGKIWLEMSTTDEGRSAAPWPKRWEALGAHSHGRGPVFRRLPPGGPRETFSIFVGGERAAFEKVLPALTSMGRRILHTGGLGFRVNPESGDQLPLHGSPGGAGRGP